MFRIVKDAKDAQYCRIMVMQIINYKKTKVEILEVMTAVYRYQSLEPLPLLWFEGRIIHCFDKYYFDKYCFDMYCYKYSLAGVIELVS